MNKSVFPREPVSRTEEDQSLTLDEIVASQGRGVVRHDRLNGPVTGILSRLDDSGIPVVAFREEGIERSAPARSLAPLSGADVGREVALLFERNDPLRPIIIGVFRSCTSNQPVRSVELQADGERLTLTADREIVLKCGAASITLTREGKVLIRGAYVLSRSSGVNKIKGGSVQIN
jgi:hypothetical protein